MWRGAPGSETLRTNVSVSGDTPAAGGTHSQRWPGPAVTQACAPVAHAARRGAGRRCVAGGVTACSRPAPSWPRAHLPAPRALGPRAQNVSRETLLGAAAAGAERYRASCSKFKAAAAAGRRGVSPVRGV